MSGLQARADRRDDLIRRLRVMLLGTEREQDAARLEALLWDVYVAEERLFKAVSDA